MKRISRRDALSGMLSGASLVMLCPTLPGCSSRQYLLEPNPPRGALGVALERDHAELFGVDQQLASKVLQRALQSGGDAADLFLEQRATDSLKLEEGKVNLAHASMECGAGVRVIKGDQCGYAYTESRAEEDLLRAAATAAMIASGKPQGSAQDFRSIAVPSRYSVRKVPTEVPVTDKMALLRRVDKAARSASREVRVVVAFIDSSCSRVLLYRSDGLVVGDLRPMITLGCIVSVQRGKRVERSWFFKGGMHELAFFGGNRPEEIAREAVRRATIALEAVVPPAGEMPVVLGAGYAGILLHEAVGHGLEADFNRKKISIYADRIGEKVAADFCTIVDDGTVQHSGGAVNVDDEGTPGQCTVLIEKGVLRSYMSDLISARLLGTAPTGNGRRESYRHQPIPRMRTTYMLAGPHSKEELFAGIERGIYAVDFTSGEVNIGGGDYAFFVAYGYLIEKGRITRPIKDVNIIGNGPQTLQRIDRVANDLVIPDIGGACGKDGQVAPVGFGMPHVRISRATVGGRGLAGG